MRTAALGDVTQIVSGATPKTTRSDYWGGDVKWATPADLGKLDGRFISHTPRTLTEEGLRSCAATVLPAGSILLSSRAPIGHVAINLEPMATNQGFKSLIPGPEIYAGYLLHWLRGNIRYLQSLGNGATFKELSRQSVEQIRVPLPSVNEQHRIAAILDHSDALRARRRDVATCIDTLVSSILEEMFGRPQDWPTRWPMGRDRGHD